ncbi:MAG: AAA family ATPase [Gemmatimonadota bacterium]
MLRTLGSAGLYPAESGPPLLGPGKPFALLVYLASSPGRRTSREFLLDLLWADVEPDRARRTLRQTLFQLRHLLGDDAIQGTEELTLGPAITIDREQFLAHVERGALDAALAGYPGDFLTHFGVPGGAAFEQWADLERHRLRSAYLRTADLLVRRHLNAAHFREALALARQARDRVPESEFAWRLLLEAAIAGNDILTATIEADALLQIAAREELHLEVATRTLIDRARGLVPGTSELRPSTGLVAELTGRESEFSAITTAWANTRQGRALHLHLSAPAGLGKSRLLHDACARLAAAGAPIVRVQGMPGDRDVPYAFAGDIAAALVGLPGAAGVAPASAATLVALNPALSSHFAAAPDPMQGEEALRRRTLALVDLTQAVAHEQPFVLAIDDLHWIDQASWRIIEGLFQRLTNIRVLCVTASRPERHPSDDSVTTLTLAPLTIAQLGSLISGLGILRESEPWATALVDGVHRATGGSPLLVLETLRLAVDQETLTLDRDGWHCHDESQLRTLLETGSALRERIRRLPADESWLLALLATAGAPLDVETLSPVTGRNLADLTQALAPLEVRGLVRQSERGWTTTHDEIAAAARDAQSEEQGREAHRLVGQYHERGIAGNPEGLLRASRHFLAAGATLDLQRLHRSYLLRARVRGDRRDFTALTAELIGTTPSDPQAATLVASLPRRWRLGLWSATRQRAAVLMALVLPIGALAAARVREQFTSRQQHFYYIDSNGAASGFGASLAEWDGNRTPVTLGPASARFVSPALAHPEIPPAISPDGKAVAWTGDSGDSTTLDLWIRTAAGTRRLTSQARDDLANDWLPDGSGVVGMSNRWSPAPPHGEYDIAVFDTATGAARQITRGPGHDTEPFASPDGTRIAFRREMPDGPARFCVTDRDGTREPECRAVGNEGSADLAGWAGLDELVLITLESGERQLLLYDWSRDTRQLLSTEVPNLARLSRDRRWLVVATLGAGATAFRDVVMPLANPGNARPVAHRGSVRNAARWWEGPADRSLLIDHLEFSDSVAEAFLGIGTRLRVRALTAADVEVPIRVPVSWNVSDTTVARVDSTGEVRPRAPGVVSITATIAGWRSATRRLVVVGQPPATMLDERWHDDWQSRWLPWGDPVPIVVASSDGTTAFWNRGDGSYQSFAVSRRTFPATHGLGLEVRLSTTLSSNDHQRIRTAFVPGIDLRVLASANQRQTPPRGATFDASCFAGFPGPGSWGATRIAMGAAGSRETDIGRLVDSIRTGKWWRLRLQIFPDGRCGVAVNGQALWISPGALLLDTPFRVVLGDESADSRLLHGPLQVWSGVRTDIDWSKK